MNDRVRRGNVIPAVLTVLVGCALLAAAIIYSATR